MPLVASAYTAPRWLRHGHVQTVLPLFLPRRRQPWPERERLELADGDFMDLNWRRGGKDRLAILAHGLEGSADAIYMRGMARTLALAGWDVAGLNYRGCSGVPNRLPRSYHSGETGDLREVIGHVAEGYRCISLIGFSLGGNIVLKYLGEQPPHPAVCAAVAISAPIDLASSAAALDDVRANRLYQRRFLHSLMAKARAKTMAFGDALGIDLTRLPRIRTIRAFDDWFTAPLHGFADAEDYWAKASSLPHLHRIGVPALLLNALNDPLLAPASFPETLARDHPWLHLETPRHGGHVGFTDWQSGLAPWHEARVVAFLEAASSQSKVARLLPSAKP